MLLIAYLDLLILAEKETFLNVFLVDYVYVCLFEPLVVLEEHMPNSYIIF